MITPQQALTGNDMKSIDLTPTWLAILPALLAVIANGDTVEARKAAEGELLRMAGLADALVATLNNVRPLAKTLREALDNLGGEVVDGGYALDDPEDVHLIVALHAARNLASRF